MTFITYDEVFLQYQLFALNKVLSVFLCLALAVPTLESVVSQFWNIDITEVYHSEIYENESDKTESEKEEKKEKELEEFFIKEKVLVVLSSKFSGWLENSCHHQSWVSEVPSPPPDYKA